MCLNSKFSSLMKLEFDEILARSSTYQHKIQNNNYMFVFSYRLTDLETFEATVTGGFNDITTNLTMNDQLNELNDLLGTVAQLRRSLPQSRGIADVSTMFAIGSRANNMKEIKDRLDVLENHDALMSNAMIRLVERSTCTLNKVNFHGTVPGS